MAEDVILKDRYTWRPWFQSLKVQADQRRLWHLVNPECQGAENPLVETPMYDSIEEVQEKLTKKAKKDAEESDRARAAKEAGSPGNSLSLTPSEPILPTNDEVIRYHAQLVTQ